MAGLNRALHGCTSFNMMAFYAMNLRISELAANKGWISSMKYFHSNHDDNW